MITVLDGPVTLEWAIAQAEELDLRAGPGTNEDDEEPDSEGLAIIADLGELAVLAMDPGKLSLDDRGELMHHLMHQWAQGELEVAYMAASYRHALAMFDSEMAGQGTGLTADMLRTLRTGSRKDRKKLHAMARKLGSLGT